MQAQLIKRVAALKSEFAKGQTRLQTLETEAFQLKETLLRISGAIQVLEEEIGKTQQQNNAQQQIPAESSQQ